MDILITLAILWKDAPQVQLQFIQQIQQMLVPASKPTPQHLPQQQIQFQKHPGHLPLQQLQILPQSPAHWHHQPQQHSSTSTNGSLIFPTPPLVQLKLHYSPEDPILPSPLSTPKEAYVAAVEEVCFKLPPKEADELRSDCCCLLRDHQPPSKSTSHYQNTGP